MDNSQRLDLMEIVDEDSLVKSLNCIGAADSNTRVDYICQLLSACTDKEVKGVQNRLNRVKRTIVRSGTKLKTPLIRKRELFLVNRSSTASGQVSGSEPVPLKEPEPEYALAPAAKSLVSVTPRPWFEDYDNEDIVALDVEKVILKEKKNGIKNMAAVISIVSKKYTKTLTVYHHPSSFQHQNPFWRKLTGFNENSFMKGEDLLSVQRQVRELLDGKLVIVCAGADDFVSMGLNMGDYDVFDLQSHWKKNAMNSNGVVVSEPLSLRALAMHYLKKDPQASTHSAEIDAKFTLELFHVYKKIKKTNVDSRFNISYDEFDDIQRPENPIKNIRKKRRNN